MKKHFLPQRTLPSNIFSMKSVAKADRRGASLLHGSKQGNKRENYERTGHSISGAVGQSFCALPLFQFTGTISKCSIHFSKVYPHQLSPPCQDFLHCQCSSEINFFTFHPFFNFSDSVVPSCTKT